MHARTKAVQQPWAKMVCILLLLEDIFNPEKKQETFGIYLFPIVGPHFLEYLGAT